MSAPALSAGWVRVILRVVREPTKGVVCNVVWQRHKFLRKQRSQAAQPTLLLQRKRRYGGNTSKAFALFELGNSRACDGFGARPIGQSSSHQTRLFGVLVPAQWGSRSALAQAQQPVPICFVFTLPIQRRTRGSRRPDTRSDARYHCLCLAFLPIVILGPCPKQAHQSSAVVAFLLCGCAIDHEIIPVGFASIFSNWVFG
jgi:hypothetical protein